MADVRCVIPTPQSQPSLLLRSERKDQNGRNPADSCHFLFKGGHSQGSLHVLHEAGLILTLLTRFCLPPNQTSLLASNGRVHAFPLMGPDISHPGVHMTAHPLVWLSSSSAAWLCSSLRSLLASFLEATVAPPMCLSQAGLASLAVGFQKAPCLPHHKPIDTIITAHLPQQNINS